MWFRHHFQDQKVKVTRPLWLVVLAGQHGHTVMVTYPYAYMMYIVSPLAGLGGGISWRLPAYSLLLWAPQLWKPSLLVYLLIASLMPRQQSGSWKLLSTLTHAECLVILGQEVCHITEQSSILLWCWQTVNGVAYVIFRLDALALSVIATATWLAGWLSVTAGIVSKRLNVSEYFFDHLIAPS